MIFKAFEDVYKSESHFLHKIHQNVVFWRKKYLPNSFLDYFIQLGYYTRCSITLKHKYSVQNTRYELFLSTQWLEWTQNPKYRLSAMPGMVAEKWHFQCNCNRSPCGNGPIFGGRSKHHKTSSLWNFQSILTIEGILECHFAGHQIQQNFAKLKEKKNIRSWTRKFLFCRYQHTALRIASRNLFLCLEARMTTFYHKNGL